MQRGISNVEMGRHGEQIAKEYPKSKGYKFGRRDFYKIYGTYREFPTDFVCSKNKKQVFVEVKTKKWKGNKFDRIFELTTKWQTRFIKRVLKNKENFELIVVYFYPDGKLKEINSYDQNHLKIISTKKIAIL